MSRALVLLLSMALLSGVGCNDSKSSPAGNDKVREALNKLPPEDRAIAEQQRLCPVTGEELGSMGAPVKVTVRDQVVFLCCKGCEKKALENPDETLRKIGKAKGPAEAKWE